MFRERFGKTVFSWGVNSVTEKGVGANIPNLLEPLRENARYMYGKLSISEHTIWGGGG